MFIIVQGFLFGNMAEKAVFIGLVFSILAFAVKGGMGLAFRSGLGDRRGMRLMVPGYFAAYGVLFAAGTLIARSGFIHRHMEAFLKIAETGVLLHLALAGGLLVWGMALLKRDIKGCGKTRASWLLLVPCPVCLAVILTTTAVLYAVFPHGGMLPALAAYGIFAAISMVTMVSVAMISRIAKGVEDSSPLHRLGTVMVLLASYFIATLCITPHVSAIPSIYAIASRDASGPPLPGVHKAVIAGICIVLFVSGYIAGKRKQGEAP